MTQMSKGSNIPLSATRIRAELVWDTRPGTPDVDASALLLAASGKVRSDDDFVFFNQADHASGAVRKVPKQPAGSQVRDALEIDLTRVEPAVERIVLGASADGGTFGQVGGLHLLVTDLATGAEVARFDMTATTETAFVSGEIYQRNGAWKLRAVGQGYASGLEGLATDFGITVDDAPAAPATPPAPAVPVTPPAATPPAYVRTPTPPPPAYVRPTPPAPQAPQAPAAPAAATAPTAGSPSIQYSRPGRTPAPSTPASPAPQAPTYGYGQVPAAGPSTPPSPPAPSAPIPGYAPPPTGAPLATGAPSAPYGAPSAPYGAPAAPTSSGTPVNLDKGRVSLQKNQRVSLTKTGAPALTQIQLGLGWDPAVGSKAIDLDASAIVLDAAGKDIDLAWFMSKKACKGAVKHLGDNVTGQGDGDDEVIVVDLDKLPAEAAAIVFTINSFSSHKFTDVKNAYCRLVDSTTRTELVRFDLTDSKPATGVFMCVLRRAGSIWEMEALGSFQDGRTVKSMRGPAAAFVRAG